MLLQDAITLRADTRVQCYTKSAVASDAMKSRTIIHSMLLHQSWKMWVLFHIIVVSGRDCLFWKKQTQVIAILTTIYLYLEIGCNYFYFLSA